MKVFIIWYMNEDNEEDYAVVHAMCEDMAVLTFHNNHSGRMIEIHEVDMNDNKSLGWA